MKKIGILIVSFVLWIPCICKASQVDYKIEHFYVDATILSDGDLLVKELIVLDGKFNGYIRELAYKNPRLDGKDFSNHVLYNAHDIEEIELAAKKVGNVTFDTLYDTDFDVLKNYSGSSHRYEKRNLDEKNGYSYKMYYAANKESVAFRLTYKVKDVIVMHEDVSELYWTFIGEGFLDSIHDLKIKVALPYEDTSNLFRVWAHGDVAGEVQKEGHQTIVASMDSLDKKSAVDLRATFSSSVLDSSQVVKKSHQKAFDEIIKVEMERAEEANRFRAHIKFVYHFVKFSSLAYVVLLILVWIYVFLKYDKEYKSLFNLAYNREFIDDYNVEVVDYLMNKSITPNALSASILNLVYKKVIKFEAMESQKKHKDYVFTLIGDTSHLNDTEKYLVEFLFNKVGNQTTFTTIELQAYAKGEKTMDAFCLSYTTWKNKVKADGKREGFFENALAPKIIGIVFLFLSILIIIFAFANVVVSVYPFISLFFGFVFFVYTLVFTKKTKKGIEHYRKWKAFKKFLEDFGTFSTKELPEFILWERYMVYATVFGIAQKVSKVMNVKMQELNSDGHLGDLSLSYYDFYMFRSINDIVHTTMNANTTAITAARVQSKSSSGSGFGGGFSSGSGFGGGGGGGHGF